MASGPKAASGWIAQTSRWRAPLAGCANQPSKARCTISRGATDCDAGVRKCAADGAISSNSPSSPTHPASSASPPPRCHLLRAAGSRAARICSSMANIQATGSRCRPTARRSTSAARSSTASQHRSSASRTSGLAAAPSVKPRRRVSHILKQARAAESCSSPSPAASFWRASARRATNVSAGRFATLSRRWPLMPWSNHRPSSARASPAMRGSGRGKRFRAHGRKRRRGWASRAASSASSSQVDDWASASAKALDVACCACSGVPLSSSAIRYTPSPHRTDTESQGCVDTRPPRR